MKKLLKVREILSPFVANERILRQRTGFLSRRLTRGPSLLFIFLSLFNFLCMFSWRRGFSSRSSDFEWEVKNININIFLFGVSWRKWDMLRENCCLSLLWFWFYLFFFFNQIQNEHAVLVDLWFGIPCPPKQTNLPALHPHHQPKVSWGVSLLSSIISACFHSLDGSVQERKRMKVTAEAERYWDQRIKPGLLFVVPLPHKLVNALLVLPLSHSYSSRWLSDSPLLFILGEIFIYHQSHFKDIHWMPYSQRLVRTR